MPEHVAIVMDGNGRWANRQGLTRIEGHKAGEAALLDVVAGAIQAGVKHLSVYAFSTENWKRSPDEVRFLMGFNRDVLHRRRDQLNEWGVRIRWAGPQAAAVGVGHQRAAVRRAAHRGQRRPDPHDVRELRRPHRDRRRGARDRRRRRSRSAEALGRHREAHRRSGSTCPSMPDVDLFVRSSAASSAPRTSCSGSRRTPRWCSSTRCGPTSRASTCGRRSSCTLAATAASAARSTRPAARSSAALSTREYASRRHPFALHRE